MTFEELDLPSPQTSIRVTELKEGFILTITWRKPYGEPEEVDYACSTMEEVAGITYDFLLEQGDWGE